MSTSEWVSKWQDYYDRQFTPWETNQASSHLRGALNLLPAPPARCIEMGCGTGSSSIFLAKSGYNVVAIDLIEAPINTAKARAISAGVDDTMCQFIQADALNLPTDGPFSQPFDFLFDSSCFHCIREVDAGKSCQVYAKLVRPGGMMMVLTGNANEPYRGPNILTYNELHDSFAEQFEVLSIVQARYDHSQEFPEPQTPPLAWVGLFRRR
eukprot:TRINITY_DN14770_c0_g1_i1.p1 TRINITY_DN14770_c0_g1~~TRINITY_DN14770_c0_g1_i1.p1  ORF type:complete len:231 (-),score=22.92 TRINITY_DN14770_c0_g1_i1:366-995(-)